MNNKLTDDRIHELKIYPEFFSAVCAGTKRAELRMNDRSYRTGDVLRLCEYDNGALTGAAVDVDVVHVADVGYWCPGYVVLSIELQERRKADSELVSHRYKLDQSGDVTEKGDFPEIPTDWVMVPVEPTPKMLVALWEHRVSMRGISENKIARTGYSNMLAASTSARKAWFDKLSASWPINHAHLSELYHAQEKRLFKLAQRIKGQTFDKYSHSPSQAIDVLEAAIFGENEDASRAAMLQDENFPVTPDGWIKCSDRTPETGQAVIGCVDFDSDIITPLVREFIWTGSTFRRGVCSTGVKSNDSIVVTHWMPLPAAPKKD
ncbi:DUF3850 domain-containing protein [Salmonella enterica]|uniref:DUF3850 domain-containing protein n=1 Tax=Salmonella enterica TaxID=28901 RepID=UPI0019947B5A|nr:DUF3850 domain-containing protein [Salmonella enterica subsp. enterica serovar Malstatt]EEI6239132.1 DUF3850 domain-containing protein [Salmonella enterica subsp. enterica serovar Tudu]EGC2274774.1 DUF3850 domain-containing protein [Salmonella enterica subsp. enterica serovar Agbeni]EHS5124027.1 DUF3850 domain-containing protein [Salmonella enterica subsp. enterica serovar Agbeni]HCM2495326.1 DUF3850 domain-containing protein [Salmonella enterica subsp. enterica serovar Lehrte]